jgi:hypothetical protein
MIFSGFLGATVADHRRRRQRNSQRWRRACGDTLHPVVVPFGMTECRGMLRSRTTAAISALNL